MFASTIKRAGVGVVALGLTVALASCTSGDPLAEESGDTGGGTITIGNQNFGESEILAQIYGQVLAANGYDVAYEPGIGSRETFILALQDGSIDLIPDYAGNALIYANPDAEETSAEDVEAALPAALESLGLAVTAAAPGEDSDALVVTPEYAEANDLTTIGDLAPLASSITLGANTEFEPRWRDGLAETYGFEGWAFKAIDDYGGPGTLADLLAGNIQVADIYTTTPSIAQNDLVVLEDDLDLFAAQNIIPLLNADVLTPEIQELLDEVSALITTDVLLDLNAQFAGDDKPSAADVAEAWLTEQGLL
ncbi:ABC transporter substrate-binding protein [Pseudolysinimonas sp.]|jgi:osmoprotectant transport system substrate-binding protein|uniref:ABC transporter substrate-binding protein n=1 Tax=Pseudolysinimonas sp. TaxID=2680009 RepID=UPI0037835A68